MPNVTFQPGAVTVFVSEGESLLYAAKLAGMDVETPCGGGGVCGKCLVRVEGDVYSPPNAAIDASSREHGWTLICQARVKTGHVVVNTVSGTGIEEYEDRELYDFSLWQDSDFIAKTERISIKEPHIGDGLSDMDRLKQGVGGEIELPLEMLRELPEIMRRDDIKLSKYEAGKIGVVHAAAFLKGEPLSIACDIGTTTVAVCLVDSSGRVVKTKSGYNAQIACGLDVISRINYAAKPDGLFELKKRVLDSINTIIKELCPDTGNIVNISIAANTVMMHLLLGIVPEYIRLSPYTPAVYNVPLYTAGELGLLAAPGAPVYMAPAVGSYVGGDITSGLLCTSIAEDSEEICLFIDIGTNGEIVVGNRDFLLGCACSAGPAFEGGGIGCGMRAARGAIERVNIDECGNVNLTVIGGITPIGICGSGIISLISELYRNGIIDQAGKLISGEKSFVLTHAGANTKPIEVSEADIQNVIRAKAAVFSACRTLLRSVDMDFGDLSRVYIAGGFGRYLDIEDAETIGLIPHLGENVFRFIGNASLTGAYMTLVSSRYRRKQDELASMITYVDLSCEAAYMDEYTAALFIPHTDGDLWNMAISSFIQ